mgnify:CR=1 FL=1
MSRPKGSKNKPKVTESAPSVVESTVKMSSTNSTNNITNTSNTVTNKQHTAAEMKEWYEKNKKTIENFANADESIKKLKNVNSTSKFKSVGQVTKESLRTYLQNPSANEKNIRNLSRYLYVRSQIYYRLVKFYANMFDLNARSVIPPYSLVDKNKPKDKLILEKDFSEVLNQNIQLESSFKPSKNTFYMKFSGKRLIFHLVAINLTQTQVFSVFPEDSFLSDFAKINNSTIAINACPFTKDLEPVGIVIENENLISPPVTKYSAFVLDNQNIPKIVQNQFEINPEDTKIAIGGFFTIIKDGKPFGSYADIQDSRTVIGISEDNKQLFLLVVEGEFFSNSQGLSYKNCTDLLLKIGVKNAINLVKQARHAIAFAVAGDKITD